MSTPALLDLLRTLVQLDGSDLHITTATPPQVRVKGHLERLPFADLGHAETKQLIYSVLTDAPKKTTTTVKPTTTTSSTTTGA